MSGAGASRMSVFEACKDLSDEVLSKDLKFLSARDHHGLAVLLAHLGEFDRRQLSVKESGISLFTHCVRVLGYDEFDAYRRIRAARAAAKHPLILDLVDQGKLTLTAVVLLSPVLDDGNHRAWLQSACGKSRRQLEALIAARHPQQARPDLLRRFPPSPVRFAEAAPPQAVDVLPAGTDSPSIPAYPAVESEIGPREAVFAPAAPPAAGQSRPHEWQAIVAVSIDRVRIGFDAGIDVMRLIDRARIVLGHKYPAGRLEDVVRDALEVFLDRKDPQRRLVLKPAGVVREGTSAPREPAFLRDTKAGRYIPMRVKSAVWQRDGGRCAWRFPDGTVCGSKERVEYDHVRPFARGGRSDSPRNVRLLCRAHNQLRAAEAGLSARPAS